MAQVNVDRTETGLLIMALSYLEDARLDEAGRAARARLAYKLGAAFADVPIEDVKAAADHG